MDGVRKDMEAVGVCVGDGQGKKSGRGLSTQVVLSMAIKPEEEDEE